MMLEINEGGMMEKEVFSHTLQALFQDLERVEQKRRRMEQHKRRQGKVSIPAGHDYEQAS